MSYLQNAPTHILNGSTIGGKEIANKEEVQLVDDALTTHWADDASTTKKGHVQLNNTVTSTLATQAATANAVKQAYDRADAAFTSANSGKTAVANAVTAKGVTASPADTFPMLATKIGQISTGKKWASGMATSSTTQDFFPNISGGNNSSHFITISGLDFTAATIIIYGEANTGNSIMTTTVYNTALYTGSDATARIYARIEKSFQPATLVILKIQSPAYISGSGFKIPVMGQPSVNHNWMAYE